MLVTINTDASVIKEEYGGYAFWIVCNEGKLQKAGYIKQKTRTSNEAEIFCLANALYSLLKSKFTGISKVIINTDSKYCIDMLTGGGRVPNNNFLFRKGWDECIVLMYEILLKNGRSLRDKNKFFEFRHVKAHTGTKDARSHVNRWCDEQAKYYAKKLSNTNK